MIIKKGSMRSMQRIWGMVTAAFVAMLAPAVAFAQDVGQTLTNTSGTSGTTLSQTNNLNDLVGKAIGFFNLAIYLIVALAILTFVWNVYNYFVKGDPENRKEAGLYVMYSVIGIFVILSFWGLVNIISNTLNINTNPGTINVGNLIGNITGGSSGSSPFSTNSSSGGSSPNTTVTSGGSATNQSVSYQEQASQLYSSMQSSGCFTVSFGVVNTPACQSLNAQYQTAQEQANNSAYNADGSYNDSAANCAYYQDCTTDTTASSPDDNNAFNSDGSYNDSSANCETYGDCPTNNTVTNDNSSQGTTYTNTSGSGGGDNTQESTDD